MEKSCKRVHFLWRTYHPDALYCLLSTTLLHIGTYSVYSVYSLQSIFQATLGLRKQIYNIIITSKSQSIIFGLQTVDCRHLPFPQMSTKLGLKVYLFSMGKSCKRGVLFRRVYYPNELNPLLSTILIQRQHNSFLIPHSSVQCLRYVWD